MDIRMEDIPMLGHGWRCWLRGWRYTYTDRGAWLARQCRRCGRLEESLLGLYSRRASRG